MQKDLLPRSPGLATIQAKLLIDFAQNKGISASRCLRETGLSLVQLQDNQKEISPQQEIRIIENILNCSETCPFALGYEFGFKNNLRSMGVIGHSILSAATLKESIKVASRYYPNAFHWVKYGVKYTDDYYKVIFKVETGISQQARIFVLARDIGIIAAIHYDVLNKRKDSIDLFSFSFPRPPGMALLEADFSANFVFEQPGNYFQASSANLSLPMPFANKQTSILLEQQCQDYLAAGTDESDVLAQISRLLNDNPSLASNKDYAASCLNMSGRTLTRKLAASGTTWSEVLTRHKLSKAMSLLESTDLDIKGIAERVGYSSSSVLSRKLADSIGLSAVEYRKKNRR